MPRAPLNHRWCASQSGVSQLCSPRGLGPQRGCGTCQVLANGGAALGTGDPGSRSLPTQPPAPSPAPRTLRSGPCPARTQQGSIVALGPCPPPPSAQASRRDAQRAHGVPGSGADTRETRWTASLVGSPVVTMVFGSAVKPSPSRCPSLAPPVTVNVNAASIDDYNHTKSGTDGLHSSATAIKFTNSP